jgi:hypothetical protein
MIHGHARLKPLWVATAGRGRNFSLELEFDTGIKVPVKFLRIKLSGIMRAAAPRVMAERRTIKMRVQQIAKALVSIF